LLSRPLKLRQLCISEGHHWTVDPFGTSPANIIDGFHCQFKIVSTTGSTLPIGLHLKDKATRLVVVHLLSLDSFLYKFKAGWPSISYKILPDFVMTRSDQRYPTSKTSKVTSKVSP
jgi:hypothetical protein